MKKTVKTVCVNCRLFSNKSVSHANEKYDGTCNWGIYGELIKNKKKHTCSQWSRIIVSKQIEG